MNSVLRTIATNSAKDPSIRIRHRGRPLLAERHRSVYEMQSSSPTGPRLSPTTLAYHNKETYSEDDLRSNTSSGAGSPHPWGFLKPRSSRGSLVQRGLTNCSDREIDLGCQLIAAAWVTGALDLGMMFWPEEDETVLGNTVSRCWDMVEDEMESGGYASHPLEETVARKVCFDYLLLIYL
jgi:hypothetical protein